jgi:DNA-directed RNA polymerase specialized sigma24 family protein
MEWYVPSPSRRAASRPDVVGVPPVSHSRRALAMAPPLSPSATAPMPAARPEPRSISPEAFHRFLTWLSPDGKAGDKYNEIHARLAKVFACRGCDRPDDLADETLDRVIRKIDVLAQNYEGDPAAYLHGVAKNVLLEDARRRARMVDGARVEAVAPPPSDDGVERRHAALEHCLACLEPQDRELIMQYYRGERWSKIERRQHLADEAQLSSAALRKRTQRIRTQLRNCLARCLAGSGQGRNA